MGSGVSHQWVRSEKCVLQANGSRQVLCDGFGDVVVDDHGSKQHEKHKCGLVDTFLNLQADVATHDAFDEEEQDYAAVHDGDGQEIKDPKIQADHGGDAEQWHPALFLSSIT